MVYRLASSTLLKFESTDVAWLAADRAMTVARATDDTICLARATRSVARAMTEGGQRREAVDVLMGMAGRMEHELPTGSGELVSLYGMLLLPAEIAAARDEDADTARLMHEQALDVARTLGLAYTDRMTAFGVMNVRLHRLAALVRLREGGQAIAYAKSLDGGALKSLPLERRVNYLLDIAEAHRQCGQPREATASLLAAERVAPEEVRCRPAAHQLIRALLDTAKGPLTPEVWQLARRAGLPT